MATDNTYLCKDCIHSHISPFAYLSYIFELKEPQSHWYKCSKTFKDEHEVADPVIGPKNVKPELSYCEIERKYGNCGPDAKNWVPKKKKDLFKMLTKEYND